MRLAFVLFTLIVLSSCNTSEEKSSQIPIQDSDKIQKPQAIATDSTIENHKVHFIASSLINFNQKKLSWGTREPINIDSLMHKKDRALFLLDSIVNTSRFRDLIINRSFTHTRNLSNEEIYQEFINPKYKSIRENLILAIDTSYLWNVTYQNRRHPSIGYDNSVGDSTVNTVQIQLVKYLSPEDYAAHIAHEYCHMIGFSHSGFGKWRGVPYGIQHIVEKMLMGSEKKEED
jgi:hypothetical protein